MTETGKALLGSPLLAAVLVLISVIITAAVTSHIASARIAHDRREAEETRTSEARQAARERLFEKRYDALMNAVAVIGRGMQLTARPGLLPEGPVWETMTWAERDQVVTQMLVLTDDEITLQFTEAWDAIYGALTMIKSRPERDVDDDGSETSSYQFTVFGAQLSRAREHQEELQRLAREMLVRQP